MILEALVRLLLVLRPEAVGLELLVAAGLAAVVLAVAAVLRAVGLPMPERSAAEPGDFTALRVLLRVSDPAAAGHTRARAPGRTR